MKKTSVKPSKKIKIHDQTHDSLPASVGLVKEVREELRADIRALDHRLQSLDSKLDAVEHRLEAKIELVLVSAHRTQVLMEEQRGENRIVLDGLKNLFQRQDRIENDFSELQSTVLALAAGVKR